MAMADKPRSQRIKVVLMLAERREQEAAEQLSHYRQLHHAETQQLAQLQEYQRDYLARYGANTGAVEVDQLGRYSQFIRHLGTVVQEQQDKLQHMAQELDIVRNHWHQRYQQRKAVEDLIARLRAAESTENERKLQKVLDELATNIHSLEGKPSV